MVNKKTYSKPTLITYLLNELGNGNFEVTTVLDENGCWTGKVIIEQSSADRNDDAEYYKAIAESLERIARNGE